MRQHALGVPKIQDTGRKIGDVEVKNDIALMGTLHSVDQDLNVKLTKM